MRPCSETALKVLLISSLNLLATRRMFWSSSFGSRSGRASVLACNLTYGLPQVFSRHPVIDVPGLVEQVARQVNGSGVKDWKLGKTKEVSPELHVIPLIITLDQE